MIWVTWCSVGLSDRKTYQFANCAVYSPVIPEELGCASITSSLSVIVPPTFGRVELDVSAIFDIGAVISALIAA